MSTHTISVFVENRHGALSRIAGLFSSRGYNIESLTVAPTEDASVSRMTIVVAGDESVLEQVNKQLNKLIDVIKVADYIDTPLVERELLLVRLDAAKGMRHEIIGIAQAYGGAIASMTASSIIIELTAPSKTIDDFIAVVKSYGVKDLVRSGKVAMAEPQR